MSLRNPPLYLVLPGIMAFQLYGGEGHDAGSQADQGYQSQ